MSKVVTFGEVMLRLATPGFERFGQSDSLGATFGGGEANVAVSLANYGVPVSFITRMPNNDIAKACVNELRGLGVDVSDIVFGGERMGVRPGLSVDEHDYQTRRESRIRAGRSVGELVDVYGAVQEVLVVHNVEVL